MHSCKLELFLDGGETQEACNEGKKEVKDIICNIFPLQEKEEEAMQTVLPLDGTCITAARRPPRETSRACLLFHHALWLASLFFMA